MKKIDFIDLMNTYISHQQAIQSAIESDNRLAILKYQIVAQTLGNDINTAYYNMNADDQKIMMQTFVF